MAKVFPISLGCPKNLVDTEQLLGQLQSEGSEVVFRENDADVILLNTCGFIQPAVEESETEIKRILKLKKAGQVKKVIVAGCLVQRNKAKLEKKFPEVDNWVGISKNINSLPRFISTLPHTAYLKIADGCDNCCSYCTIPMIRGGYRSKPKNDIINEARMLVDQGVREISLIAQDTTSYGVDLYGEYRLVDLLKDLTKIPGLAWIRLMYAYPERITDDLLYLMAAEPKICKYIDMPIQHAADNILRSMNRPSTERQLREKIQKMREIVPGIAIRTNVIVGYPGETKHDFEILKKFLKEVECTRVGVFTYWREKGTPAAEMPGQIDLEIKKQRCNELIDIQSRVIDTMNNNIIGKKVTVLVDGPSYGRTQSDAPDIDGGVQIIAPNQLTPGEFVSVVIQQAQGYQLTGALAT